jgi:hypothetical protein
MNKHYHLLNGDALKEQFPTSIEGNIIIARECLVDGPVHGDNLDEFFATRAEFISKQYGGTTRDYHEQSTAELLKILDIEKDATINLWFEDDLFCQVNFWFVVHLLNKNNRNNLIYLVRPAEHTRYGFGGLSQSELLTCYKQKTLLTQPDRIAALWSAYQAGDTETLLAIANQLKAPYPFIHTAVEAHIQRIPVNGHPGRPKATLLSIINELNTQDFSAVFRAFNERESIYGFGDLQVKRLYDEVINER